MVKNGPLGSEWVEEGELLHPSGEVAFASLDNSVMSEIGLLTLFVQSCLLLPTIGNPLRTNQSWKPVSGADGFPYLFDSVALLGYDNVCELFVVE